MLTQLTPAELATARPDREPPAGLVNHLGYLRLNIAAVEAIGTPRRILVAADGRGLIIAPAPPGDVRAYSLTVYSGPSGRSTQAIASIPVALRAAGLLPTGESVKYRARILTDDAGNVGGLMFTPANTMAKLVRRAPGPQRPNGTQRPNVLSPDSLIGAGLR